jgi:hypothetical protein
MKKGKPMITIKKIQTIIIVIIFSFLMILMISGCEISHKSETISPPVFSPWVSRFFDEQVCQLPCWEGIIPGETSIVDAFQILNNNPDYFLSSKPTKVSYGFPEYYEMNWTTSDAKGGGLAWSKGDEKFISEILLNFQNEDPEISLENIITSFGEPDNLVIKEQRDGICSVKLFYAEEVMEVLTIEKCQSGQLSLSLKTKVYSILLFPIDKPGFPDKNYWEAGTQEYLIKWKGFGKYPITDILNK